MLKKVLVRTAATVAVIVGILSVVVAMQPSDYRITRATTIEAPAPTVFEQVNDFHNWEAWSPWAKLDPNCKSTFEGPTSGEGAIFHWAGNDEVGEGSMTIKESQPSDRIKILLEFIKPFASIADAEFTFKPEGDQTAVTWSMTGKRNFMCKGMCLLMDMDKMVGGNFEKGLASMKEVVEAAR